MLDLYKNAKVTQVITPTAGVAATTDINGTEIDMQNFEAVTFIVTFGAITSGAVTSIKAQQDTVTGMAGAQDLLGSAVTVADTDDDKVKMLTIVKPQEQFVHVVVDRGTQNAVVASAEAIQTGARKVPVSHSSEVAGESHISPAEGTA